jgi:hypothetical protein
MTGVLVRDCAVGLIGVLQGQRQVGLDVWTGAEGAYESLPRPPGHEVPSIFRRFKVRALLREKAAPESAGTCQPWTLKGAAMPGLFSLV